MKEQSVQKGFSKKSTGEALVSCGQNQKTVQKVSREQCMCPKCFYRDMGEDEGCLFTATLENHEGLYELPGRYGLLSLGAALQRCG